jgi:hypothetical protein
VASKGLTGYGERKSAQLKDGMGDTNAILAGSKGEKWQNGDGEGQIACVVIGLVPSNHEAY